MISTHISLKTSKILQCSSNPNHVAWEKTSDLEQQSVDVLVLVSGEGSFWLTFPLVIL